MDWNCEQVKKMNAMADDSSEISRRGSREDYSDLGGIFWLWVIVDGNERLNKRYKCARSALKAYLRACARYSVIEKDIPKTSGHITLCVRRDCVLEMTFREYSKMWL